MSLRCKITDHVLLKMGHILQSVMLHLTLHGAFVGLRIGSKIDLPGSLCTKLT